MGSLFKFHNDNVEITAEIMVIKPFDQIANHKRSVDLAAYIYHMCDWQSPYATEIDEIRTQRIHQEILNPEEELSKDDQEMLNLAIEKYINLSQTDATRLLNSARIGARKLQDYFENVEIHDQKSPGAEAKNLILNLEKVGNIIKKLDEWDEMIKKGKDTAQIRKGVEINKFNEM